MTDFQISLELGLAALSLFVASAAVMEWAVCSAQRWAR